MSLIHKLSRRVFLRKHSSQLSNQSELFRVNNALPPIPGVKSELLERQGIGNDAKIDRLIKNLDLIEQGIIFKDKPQISKCFYPTKLSTVRLNEDQDYSNKHLELLGRDSMNLLVNEVFLSLFKRTSTDIGKYDFNYTSKMDNMSAWKKNPTLLVRHFLKHKDLGKLARLSIPESRIPARIQYAYDQKSFNAIIGYIIMTNERQAVDNFLRKSVARDLVQITLAR